MRTAVNVRTKFLESKFFKLAGEDKNRAERVAAARVVTTVRRPKQVRSDSARRRRRRRCARSVARSVRSCARGFTRGSDL